MSLGPTATSSMQAYGLPCAFSTEQEVRSKTARKAAPVAVEVNSEGVLQLDGLATRGMFMSGGPQTYLRNVTTVPVDGIGVVLTPAQLVDGVLLCENGTAGTAVVLPTVTALNAFLNSNLVSAAALLVTGVGQTNTPAPRTMFRLTVFTNSSIDLTFPGAAAGHGGTNGYQRYTNAANPTDAAITVPANSSTATVFAVNTSVPRLPIEIWFIQTAGSGTDPEWLVMTN